jgi:hypothetical protein
MHGWRGRKRKSEVESASPLYTSLQSQGRAMVTIDQTAQLSDHGSER